MENFNKAVTYDKYCEIINPSKYPISGNVSTNFMYLSTDEMIETYDIDHLENTPYLVGMSIINKRSLSTNEISMIKRMFNLICVSIEIIENRYIKISFDHISRKIP